MFGVVSRCASQVVLYAIMGATVIPAPNSINKIVRAALLLTVPKNENKFSSCRESVGLLSKLEHLRLCLQKLDVYHLPA